MLRNIFMLPGPRIEDVFAFVLDKPPNGSTFFKDCLVELRICCRIFKLGKFIFSKLVSELQMEARFSIDPILRLIAALSRDLKDDFAPFLPRVVNSLVVLLNNGGQKDAETIEQIFTSWSEIIENLRFCFSRDIQGALSDIINEKISRSMSCVLDLARPSQLEKGDTAAESLSREHLFTGIKMMLFEVAEQPERAARAGFLHYDMIVRLQKS
ncbi:hypothetical protein HID58_065863 [Brassica napus]|uniref:Uncharacterized protein n=1 Tax=Brassica napus TaxID=3708 RepID=A0ABQ7ZEA9_BRANA|nr:hypothetical protein HID58_065863 [Brassica napus]